MRFLELHEVLHIHRDQITRYGGTLGVRDMGLLTSAIAMPTATSKASSCTPTSTKWLRRTFFTW